MDGTGEGQHPSNGRAERTALIGSWPEALRVEWEERAGILEYEAGLAREWAELRAFIIVSDEETRRRSTAVALAPPPPSHGPHRR